MSESRSRRLGYTERSFGQPRQAREAGSAPGQPARRAALTVMKLVREGGYANLALKQVLEQTNLSSVDAAFTTELVAGTCRHQGSLDQVIERAGGRPVSSLQPGVVDVLRLGAEQLLKMRVPPHAAVAASVSLATGQIGRRVTGVVNAILRRVAEEDWDGWMDRLTPGLSHYAALGLRTAHPEWIVEAYAELLPAAELVAALEADNQPPTPTLVVRPGLMSRAELLDQGGQATPYSPWGVIRSGDPGLLSPVRQGLAGVQDEGSQLVGALLADVSAPPGDWLDMCAGPGGKAALLQGLARRRGERLLASEVHPHRARLVASALQAYGDSAVIVADATSPAWSPVFSRVMLDAPCTGLGALRRRPEARWRKNPADLVEITALQRRLVASALSSLRPGGVVAYVTCSPHRRETSDIIASVTDRTDVEIIDAPALLGQVPDCRAAGDGRFIQLWPHRHHTDAMFCALLRKG